MSKLKAAARNALPKSSFGLPAERKYPMPDRSHAANAKARASQQVAKGNLSKSAEAKIDAKANRILGQSKGSDMKQANGDLGKGKPPMKAHTPAKAGSGHSSHIEHFADKYGNGMNPGRSK